MLIGLCGAEQCVKREGLCAGKRSVADYLVKEHGFYAITLANFNKDSLRGRGESDDQSKDLPFQDIGALLDFVTKRWRERWVIKDVYNETILDALMRRPFFLLVSVDAPVSVRWKRYRGRHQTTTQSLPTLEQFVLHNDEHLYKAGHGLAHLIDRAQLRLLNPTNSMAELYASLDALKLADEQRLRPSWDQYFMQLASLAAQRSNCMKRRVGCVLVRDKRVISTGYNGTPRNIKNCNEGGCPRCNGGQGAGESLATCLCIHAEENALLEAGRERIGQSSTLYCDTCPCLTCSIKITQVGISEVVYSQSYSMDTDTALVFREAGVNLRQFSPPRNGLVDLGHMSSDASMDHLKST